MREQFNPTGGEPNHQRKAHEKEERIEEQGLLEIQLHPGRKTPRAAAGRAGNAGELAKQTLGKEPTLTQNKAGEERCRRQKQQWKPSGELGPLRLRCRFNLVNCSQAHYSSVDFGGRRETSEVVVVKVGFHAEINRNTDK